MVTRNDLSFDELNQNFGTQYTENLDQFKFRTDNRAGGVDEKHVERLMQSINTQNLLKFKPIQVNQDLEIIDGQHRVQAAKKLGIGIYYNIVQTENPYDIIRLNTNVKLWNNNDYLNFWIKNGKVEYQKFKDFMIKHNLSIGHAIRLVGQCHLKFNKKFKSGNFIFKDPLSDEIFDKINQTVDYIRKIHGHQKWINNTRFFTALAIMFKHPDFNWDTWFRNLQRLIQTVHPCARIIDFIEMIIEIYNYKLGSSKIYVENKILKRGMVAEDEK